MQRELSLTITCDDEPTHYDCVITWDSALGSDGDDGTRFLVLDDCYVERVRYTTFGRAEWLDGQDAWVRFICMRGFRFFRDALRDAVEEDMERSNAFGKQYEYGAPEAYSYH